MNFIKNLKALDNRGITHLIAPLIIGLFAVGGTYALVASHAATPTRNSAVSQPVRKAKSVLHVVSFTLSSTNSHLDSEIQAKSRTVTQADCSGSVSLTVIKKGAQTPTQLSSIPAVWNGNVCKANLDISDSYTNGSYLIKLKYDGSNTLKSYTHSTFKRLVGPSQAAKPAPASSSTLPACVGARC